MLAGAGVQRRAKEVYHSDLTCPTCCGVVERPETELGRRMRWLISQQPLQFGARSRQIAERPKFERGTIPLRDWAADRFDLAATWILSIHG